MAIKNPSVSELFSDVQRLFERCKALREASKKDGTPSETREFERLSQVQGALYCATLEADLEQSHTMWKKNFEQRTAPMCLYTHQLTNLEYAEKMGIFRKLVR